MRIVAECLGAKFEAKPGEGEQQIYGEIPAPAGPTIAEMAAAIQNKPIAKGDTMAASKEVLAMVLSGKDGGDGGE